MFFRRSFGDKIEGEERTLDHGEREFAPKKNSKMLIGAIKLSTVEGITATI